MASKATAASSLISAPLGRSTLQIQVSLIPYPASSAIPAEKARAFDYCKQTLDTNKDQFEYNELSAFITQQIPSSCNAALDQLTKFGTSLRAALFDITNLVGDSFLHSDGSRVNEDDLTKPTCTRAADISVFAVKAIVDPMKYAPVGVSLSDIQPLTMIYGLQLPQETVLTSSGQPASASYSTPRKMLLFADLPVGNNGSTDYSNIGLPGGTDLAEDYDLDVLLTLNTNKLANLKRRSGEFVTKTASLLHQTPRLAAALSGTANTVTTYTGNYDFMTTQEAFDATFSDKSFIGNDVKMQHGTLKKFIDLCKLEVLVQLIRIDCVGDLSPLITSSTSQLTALIRALKMRPSHDPAKPNELSNPDDLFNSFLDLATQLNDDTSSWGLTLAHQFHSSLPLEYTEDIESND